MFIVVLDHTVPWVFRVTWEIEKQRLRVIFEVSRNHVCASNMGLKGK